MNSSFLNQEVARLSSIEWKYNQERTDEECAKDALLVREYFKRLALFLDYLSINLNYPYIDPVQIINEAAKIDYDKVLEICPNLMNAPHGVTKTFCIHHIMWCSLVDDGDPIANNFRDIFDPLIELFRGGGYWSTEHGLLDISGRFLCRLSDWRKIKVN